MATCFAAVPALAQPSGAQAIHGTASLSQQGNKLVVTTGNGAGTNHSAINWQSFSIPSGSATHFNQPSASSTSINRVVGPDPSAIFGTLSSNGKLVLVNPSGIAVGAGAVVDTAGFTASTLRMSDADAIAGRLLFGEGSANLSVGGQIVARGGDVVLIAPNIETASSAVIQSPNGSTILAAGQKVEVTGRGLEGISLQVQAPENRAVNLGRIEGDAVGIFAGTLKHSGLINATAVTAEGGKVVLKGLSEAEIDGAVRASKGGTGGQVHATASKVRLKSGATIDVSGESGGGEVLIGGGWQGKDSRVANARDTIAESGASIKADATDNGRGGTVVLWSDDTTTLGSPRISVRGGVNGGDGGEVETSGKVNLTVGQAQVDGRAPKGKAGRWLLDPATMTIAGGIGAAANTLYEDQIEASAISLDVQATDAIITSGTFAGADVLVPTGLNLTIRTLTGGTGPGIDLTGSAHGAGLTFKTSGGGNVTMTTVNAGQAIKTSGVTVTGAGTVSLSSASTLTVAGPITTAGGAVNLVADKMDIAAPVNAGGAGSVVLRPLGNGVGIDLGSITDAGARLELSDAELDRVTAGTLRIGDAANSGGINLSQDISIAGAQVDQFSLVNAGSILSTSSAAISASKLNARSAAQVRLDQANAIGTLSGTYGGANTFVVANNGALTIGAVDGTAGVAANTGGSGNLNVTTVGGMLNVNENVLSGDSGGNVALKGDGVTLGAGKLVASPVGNITIDGATNTNNVDVSAGTLSTVGGSVTIRNANNVTVGQVNGGGGGTLTVNTNIAGSLTQHNTRILNIANLNAAVGGTITLNNPLNQLASILGASTTNSPITVYDSTAGLTINTAVNAGTALVDIRTMDGNLSMGTTASVTGSAVTLMAQGAGNDRNLTIRGSINGTSTLSASQNISFASASGGLTVNGPATVTAGPTGRVQVLGAGTVTFNNAITSGNTIEVAGGNLLAGSAITIPRLQLHRARWRAAMRSRCPPASPGRAAR